MFGFYISDIQIQIRLRFGMVSSINTHLRQNLPLPPPPTQSVLNQFTKPDLSLKYILYTYCNCKYIKLAFDIVVIFEFKKLFIHNVIINIFFMYILYD